VKKVEGSINGTIVYFLRIFRAEAGKQSAVSTQSLNILITRQKSFKHRGKKEAEEINRVIVVIAAVGGESTFSSNLQFLCFGFRGFFSLRLRECFGAEC
jgi:hypothetical protein